MRLYPSEEQAFDDLRKTFSRVRPHEKPKDPYDFVFDGPDGPVYIEAKRTGSGGGVTMLESQFNRFRSLSPLGRRCVFWIDRAMIPVESLFGIAHVHVHQFNPEHRTIVFRVKAGEVLPPRWCFGKCAGAL